MPVGWLSESGIEGDSKPPCDGSLRSELGAGSHQPAAPAPVLEAALNAANYGINFESDRLEEFLTCWFTSAETNLTAADLRPEVGGFGVPAITIRLDPSGKTHFSCRLPPGLGAGWHEVRLRTRNSEFGSPRRIAVGLPVKGLPVIAAISDGLTWGAGEIQRNQDGVGYLSVWVHGLGENCDRNNVRVYLGDSRLPVEYVSEQKGGMWQVNAIAAASFDDGDYAVTVRYGSAESPAKPVRIRA